MNSKQKKTDKGFLIVASRDPIYYSWACNLMGDIKDFHPESQVCLVTEERFVDARAEEADHLIFCDDHYRAKLWALSQTPFDVTFYIDADMQLIGPGLEKVFDELGDNDMVFTGLPRDRWYVFMDTEFPGGTFELCGAVCLYRKTDLTMEFMKDWYEYYVRQHAGKWWPYNEIGQYDYELYPQQLAAWDQFTLWWLTKKEQKYDDLKVGIFEDDLRYNYWNTLDRTKNPMPEGTVLLHMSSTATRDITQIELY